MPRLVRIPHHPVQRRQQARPPAPREDQFAENGRLQRGLLTPRSVYRRYVLRLLLAADDHAVRASEVRRAVERRMAGRFTAADLSMLRRNQPRWVNAMQWERKKMVMEGLIETTDIGGFGVWRLTREGVRAARGEVG